MKALFEVGEEVILVSKKYPELNGDAVVIKIVSNETSRCPHCENLIQYDVENGYHLSIKSKTDCCTTWHESALRKKHKGSDFSFDEMMKEIKSKKPIEV